MEYVGSGFERGETDYNELGSPTPCGWGSSHPLEHYYEIIESYGYKKNGNTFVNDENKVIDLDNKTFKRSETEKWEYKRQEPEDMLIQICKHLPYDKKYSD